MPLKVATTVDIEPPVSRTDISKLLEILTEYKVNATFFMTGTILEGNRNIAYSLLEANHELAIHGYRHRLWQGRNAERKKDIIRAIEVFEKIIGERPSGFRAPYFNVDEETLDFLDQNGIEYDSSLIPTFFRIEFERIVFQPASYIRAPTVPYHPSNKNIAMNGEMKIVEIPISVLPVLRLPISFGYFLFLGLNFYKRFIRLFDKDVMVVYLHPYQLCEKTLSLGVPKIIKSYYGKSDPCTVLREFFDFMNMRFSPRWLRMREIMELSS